jgi:hypothetical protein
MKLTVLRENKNLWLLTCFTIYIILFFIFAGIYYTLFKANPRNFLFNSDVAKSQALGQTAPIEQEISKLKFNLDAYKKLLTSKPSFHELSEDKGKEITFDLEPFEIKIRILKRGPSLLEYSVLTRGEDKTNILGSLDMKELAIRAIGENSVEGYFSEHILKLETFIAIRQALLDELQGPTAQIWSYWDFFYFSVMSQTTVGYGDILPNSTLVRLCVTIQLILGLVILTVLISLTFKKPKFKLSNRKRGRVRLFRRSTSRMLINSNRK